MKSLTQKLQVLMRAQKLNNFRRNPRVTDYNGLHIQIKDENHITFQYIYVYIYILIIVFKIYAQIVT